MLKVDLNLLRFAGLIELIILINIILSQQCHTENTVVPEKVISVSSPETELNTTEEE